MRGILDHAVEDGLITISPIPAPRRRKGASDRKHLPALVLKDAVGEVLRLGDKAEGLGVVLFEQISSEDPTALIGLPLIFVANALRTLGADPLRPLSRAPSTHL